MRANEFIFESEDDHTDHKIRDSAKKAIPGIKTWAALSNANNPYAAYKYGVMLAVSPDRTMPKTGEVGPNFVTVAYTDVCKQTIETAAKNMGITGTTITQDGSGEHESIHKVSPVPARRPNKHGV